MQHRTLLLPVARMHLSRDRLKRILLKLLTLLKATMEVALMLKAHHRRDYMRKARHRRDMRKAHLRRGMRKAHLRRDRMPKVLPRRSARPAILALPCIVEAVLARAKEQRQTRA